MIDMQGKNVSSNYLHFLDNGNGQIIDTPTSFWEQLAAGSYPELDNGRLMSAFSFSQNWSSRRRTRTAAFWKSCNYS